MTAHQGVEGADEALTGALEYAAAGYAVGPVTIRWEPERGKKRPEFHTHWEHPRAPDDVTISADQDQIVAWARRWPGCGFHAPCGPNGFVVVEGDVTRARADGAVAIKDGITAWREAGGPIPTMTVHTPSGGQHWYFPAPGEPIRNSQGVVLPGVDVRGAGGTVFIAGTRVHGHPAGGDAFYATHRVVPASELRSLPVSWEKRLRAAYRGTGTSTPLGNGHGLDLAGSTLWTPDRVHDPDWVVREVARARARAQRCAAAGGADFRTELFAYAVTLYSAEATGVVDDLAVREELTEFIDQVWHAPPDPDDRRWIAEARTRAAANPWRVREPGVGLTDTSPVLDLGQTEVENVGESESTDPDAGADDEPDTHTTWWPRESGGEAEEEPGPCALRRADGTALLYAGRVNGVIGESESGKSWIAQLATVQTILDGAHVLYFDFEDTRSGLDTRLRNFGVPDADVAERFVYVGPEEPLSAQAREDLAAVLTSRDWAVIVVDGLNAAMNLLGLDLESNKDATTFFTTFLRPLAHRTGAAVIYVDHVPKDPQARNKGGIGAQAKRAMTDGLTIRAEEHTPFGRGKSGKLRLTVDKDRMGFVRGIADEGKFIGMFKLTSTNAETGDVSAEIEGGAASGPKEPTVVMESVSAFLQGSAETWFTTNQITGEVTGRRQTIAEALNALKLRGCVARQEGANRKVEYRFVRRFTRFVAEADDVVADHAQRASGGGGSGGGSEGSDGLEGGPDDR